MVRWSSAEGIVIVIVKVIVIIIIIILIIVIVLIIVIALIIVVLDCLGLPFALLPLAASMRRKRSFRASLRPAKQQQKLPSGPRFGVSRANSPKGSSSSSSEGKGKISYSNWQGQGQDFALVFFFFDLLSQAPAAAGDRRPGHPVAPGPE